MKTVFIHSAILCGLGLTLTIASHGPKPAPSHENTPVQHSAAPAQRRPSGTEVFNFLLAGNARYAAEQTTPPNLSQDQRALTAHKGQYPVVTILSCSDSRVPLEHIFNAGIGDLFVIRTAGNVAGKVEIGSVEYGVGHLGTPLLMVLGHTKCGAVTAAATNAQVHGSIPFIVDLIKPAVDGIKKQNPKISGDELILRSIKANVWKTMENIFNTSAEIRELTREGKLKVIGAIYDLETGKVSSLGVHYQQETLIRPQEEE